MTKSLPDIEYIANRLAIIDTLSNYATGLDARDWDLWRSVFVEEVVFDLSSWSGVPPRPLNADRVVKSQAKTFAELTVTQHFFTNHRVTIDGDRARCLAHMRAEHWIRWEDGSDGRYTMFGYYDDKLVLTADGWKIEQMQLNVTQTEGERRVMDEAVARAKAKRDAAR